MTKLEYRFARIKCLQSFEKPVPLSKTVLMMDKAGNQTLSSKNIPSYRTADIISFQWDHLHFVAERVLSEAGHRIPEILHTIESHQDEIKTFVNYIIFAKEIKKFDELFAPKKKMWPLFLRDLSNEKYHNTLHSSPQVTDKIVSDKTNKIMRDAVENPKKKFLHTIRVLYRIQTEQLEILRKYNSERNNIYYTDFEEGNKASLRAGYRSSLEHLSYSEAEKRENLWGRVGISEDTYYPNGDLFFTRQLADLLMALCSLKHLDHATFWAVKGTPTIRGTLVGDNEDSNFDEAHFIAVSEYEPGVSGRLSNDISFNAKIYKELQRVNKPRRVEIRNSTINLQKELLHHIDDVEKRYGNGILEKHRKFANEILTLNYDQIKSYDRNILENETLKLMEKLKHI